MVWKPKSQDEDEFRLMKLQEAQDRKEEKKEYLEQQSLELQEEERQKYRRSDRTGLKSE